MCNENNNKNQLKVNCSPGIGHPKDGISSQNGLRNTIQVINNRAQYFADIAKNCLEEVRTILAQVREYAAQNTNVTVEFVTNKIAELRNIIETNLNNYLLKSNLNTELVNFGTNAQYVNETRLATAINAVIPSQENNENKLLSTDGEDLCWVPVHHDFSIFDIVPKDHILSYSETKGFAQLGSYVYKDAVAGSRYGYPDFYAKVIAEYQDPNNTTETVSGVTITVNANGHKFYDIADKADIDSLFTARGEAWFYGIDTTNERIFLPRSTRIKFGDTSTVGEYQEAGLPNITATWGSCFEYGSDGYKSIGAVTSTEESSYYMEIPNVAGGGRVLRDFDASRSSSVYGNSNTVEYSSTKLIPYMVVGNVSDWSGMTDVVNHGMTILEQVNQGIQSRVLLDGSNAQFPCITETYVNGTSWYRVYSDGWCEQGGTSNSSAVSFLKNYIDTNYNTSVSWLNMVSGSGQSLCVLNKTVSSISVQVKWATDNIVTTFTNGTFNWQACGYIR